MTRDVTRLQLAKQLAKIRLDSAGAIDKIMALYPRNSKIEVFLKHGQVNPTPAEVLSASTTTSGYGYVRCRLLRGKGTRHGYGHVRDICLHDIVGSGFVR